MPSLNGATLLLREGVVESPNLMDSLVSATFLIRPQ